MKTLFSNEHFIIVDKPSGWLSVDSRDPKDERHCAGREIEKQLRDQTSPVGIANAKIWPCHRLDVEASGILIFAKNSNAHRAANKWFEDHLVQKTYEAYSEPIGNPVALEALRQQRDKIEVWKSQVARGKRRSYEADFGKEAVTRAKFLGEVFFSGVSCLHWQLEPLTGRPHQLRFELFKHGSPILGDKLYGSKIDYASDAIALRAFHIKFLDKHRTMWGLPAEIIADRIDKSI